MDQVAWMSTRVVEAIVSLLSELAIGVAGLYGYAKRYPGHVALINKWFARTLKYVAESTLPCVFLGWGPEL